MDEVFVVQGQLRPESQLTKERWLVAVVVSESEADKIAAYYSKLHVDKVYKVEKKPLYTEASQLLNW